MDLQEKINELTRLKEAHNMEEEYSKVLDDFVTNIDKYSIINNTNINEADINYILEQIKDLPEYF